jgi:hypothetical protein
MVALRAQVAIEIDKTDVFEGANVAIHDASGELVSQSQEQGMRAGDFYFRSNTVAHYENPSWFRRLIFRDPQKLVVEHPTTIVMSCPYCGLPLMSQLDNKILSRHPLTLEKPIRCPFGMYDTAHAFQIKDGKIMPA